MSPTPIQFYFDFSSPYSYIANEWIDALAARHGRTVDRRAILLGVTLKAAELRPPADYPIKRDYMLRDFARSARFERVPYQHPSTFPIPTQNAARVFWWLKTECGEDAAARWARTGLRAYFTRDVALHEPRSLDQLASEAGLEVTQLEPVWSDPRWKERLRHANDEALANGVFGAPFFIVDGEPYWGNDRRQQLAQHLADRTVVPARSAAVA